MLAISIDGACRRNGKPDCVSSGGVYIEQLDANNEKIKDSLILSAYETCSTNQRGELLALIQALQYTISNKQDAMIITDSEYLFNAMTNNWCGIWESRNWQTTSGGQVKNIDMWKDIKALYDSRKDLDITFYHIKGHCITFGDVTARNLLIKDGTGAELKKALYKKYDEVCNTSKLEKITEANKLSERNNGFALTPSILRNFIVMNTMADIVATICVDNVNTNS